MGDGFVNILLIEDDYLDVMNIQRQFKKMEIEYSLVVAENGRMALEMLRGENDYDKIIPLPKLILLDINMPKMNGVEFLEELRKDPYFSNIPVFIIAASEEEADKSALTKFRISGYIVKPLIFDKYIGSPSSLETFGLFVELLKLH